MCKIAHCRGYEPAKRTIVRWTKNMNHLLTYTSHLICTPGWLGSRGWWWEVLSAKRLHSGFAVWTRLYVCVYARSTFVCGCRSICYPHAVGCVVRERRFAQGHFIFALNSCKCSCMCVCVCCVSENVVWLDSPLWRALSKLGNARVQAGRTCRERRVAETRTHAGTNAR